VAVTFSANHNLKNTQICQVAVKKSWSTENQDKKKPGTVSRGGKSSSIGSQIKLLKKKKPVLVTKVRSRRPHCVERKTRLDFKVKKKKRRQIFAFTWEERRKTFAPFQWLR
jgi:hypothetical protein